MCEGKRSYRRNYKKESCGRGGPSFIARNSVNVSYQSDIIRDYFDTMTYGDYLSYRNNADQRTKT